MQQPCIPWRVSMGGDWQRIAAGTQEYLSDGRPQITWVLAQPATWLEVAFCFPYGLPEVEQLITDTGDYWHADTIGVSQAGQTAGAVEQQSGGAGRHTSGLLLHRAPAFR